MQKIFWTLVHSISELASPRVAVRTEQRRSLSLSVSSSITQWLSVHRFADDIAFSASRNP